jgi:hypothetical protein
VAFNFCVEALLNGIPPQLLLIASLNPVNRHPKKGLLHSTVISPSASLWKTTLLPLARTKWPNELLPVG